MAPKFPPLQEKAELEGIVAMTLTPIFATEDENINYTAMYHQIDWIVEKQGVNKIVIAPSIGECFHLTQEERIELFKNAINYVKAHYPWVYMIAMTSETYTKGLKRYANAAKDLGYDAQQVIAPHYWRPAKSNIELHFTAAACILPMIIYNNPGLSKVHLERPFIKELIEKNPGIIAIKETETDGYNQLEPLFDEVEEMIDIYTTFRAFATGLMYGSTGGFINVPTIPVCNKIWELHQEKKYKETFKLQRAMGRVFPKKGEFAENPLALTKAMASVVTGIEMGEPRMPYREPSIKAFIKEFTVKYRELEEFMATL